VLKKGANILEVGCGIGYFGNAFLSYLKERFPDIYNTIHSTFFDLSPVLLSSQKETNISQLAYTEESLGRAIGKEFLARIHGLRFANISEASATVNPQSFRVLIISKA